MQSKDRVESVCDDGKREKREGWRDQKDEEEEKICEERGLISQRAVGQYVRAWRDDEDKPNKRANPHQDRESSK